MQVHILNGVQYRLPNELNDFQKSMYIHLIEWKWTHLTKAPGSYGGQQYDAILPEEFRKRYQPIYPPVVDRLVAHQRLFPFKTHKFIGHMASSQAACASLFLPLLQHPDAAAEVLRNLKPDLDRIATDQLDAGFRLEFWDEPSNMLNDHTPAAGTDADIAIAYYDQAGNLKLWLIEHKLTESEFTTCGGYRSRGRDRHIHKCDSTISVIANKDLCYYQSASGYRYWDITQAHPNAFPLDHLQAWEGCPFQGGMNQLWRNQLLALSIESSTEWPYSEVSFSVVRHPKNHALDRTIAQFKQILGNGGRFSGFTSDALIDGAQQLDHAPWRHWLEWYKELYFF